MKPLIITIAALLFAIGVWLSNLDMRLFERKVVDLEYTAVQTATVASQYLDQYEYGQGVHTFKRDVSMVAVKSYLENELNLDDSMTPIDSYWTDTLDYSVYLYDDTGGYIYTQGILTSSFSISYPYLHNSPSTGSITIIKPTIIVILDAGRMQVHNNLFGVKTATNGIRYGVYETTGRDYPHS